jgi:glycerol-3-phosphate acyltransferase PlsY
MNVWIALFAALAGYFIGALSFTRIIGSYVLPGEDVSKAEIPIKGSEKKFQFSSYGATSIRAKAGPKYGCLTSVLDMIKVTLPTLAFKVIYPEGPYFLITAAAGVAGNNFPLYYGFKGGRGLSSFYGGLVVIDWLAIPVTTIVGTCIGFWFTKYAFLSFFGVTLTLLPWFWFRFHDMSHLLYAVAINIFFWVASIPDIKMYVAYKRSGEFDKAGNRFAGLDSEFTLGPIVKVAERFGWKKKRSNPENRETKEE